MQGVVERKKRYVSVVSRTNDEGAITPLTIEWNDGKRYEIDQILECRQAASLKTGGRGLRFVIRIGQNRTYLYFEGPRWFVEEKVVELP